ncbi:MAG TPA: 30S ribosomal protein S17 [Nitrososphaeraceae archaeon]|nr:30S ribosomal protein S17 [Nitrososphaeraceae archaeon]
MVRNIGISVAPPRKSCDDKFCPFHGILAIRGKMFSGTVVSAKAKNMAVVAREYPHPVPKYKRYERSKSKLHAYIPECIGVEEGLEVKIAECRPLSKTVSFVIIEVSNKDGSKD